MITYKASKENDTWYLRAGTLGTLHLLNGRSFVKLSIYTNKRESKKRKKLWILNAYRLRSRSQDREEGRVHQSDHEPRLDEADPKSYETCDLSINLTERCDRSIKPFPLTAPPASMYSLLKWRQSNQTISDILKRFTFVDNFEITKVAPFRILIPGIVIHVGAVFPGNLRCDIRDPG